MKQRYTITIADMEINVISDESPETVESLVGSVDRKMREILTASRRCSKSEAALLCALDYCADKVQALRKVKQQEALIDTQNTQLQSMQKENDRLRIEIETLRESLLAAKSQKQEASLTEDAPSAPAEPEASSEAPIEEPVIEQISIETEETEAQPEAAPAKEAPEVPEKEQIAPEDVEFDPSELFRRVKANRSIRKGGKRK